MGADSSALGNMEKEKEMSNFWKGKRVLITGANGFLGSHLSTELLKRHACVIGIIKEDPGLTYLKSALKNMDNQNIKIIKSDIVDYESMWRIFNEYKPYICFHIAAQACRCCPC